MGKTINNNVVDLNPTIKTRVSDWVKNTTNAKHYARCRF